MEMMPRTSFLSSDKLVFRQPQDAAALASGQCDDKWHSLWVEVTGVQVKDEAFVEFLSTMPTVDDVTRNKAAERFCDAWAQKMGFAKTIEDFVEGLAATADTFHVTDISERDGVIRMSCSTSLLPLILNSVHIEKVIHFSIVDDPGIRFDGDVPVIETASYILPDDMTYAEWIGSKDQMDELALPVLDFSRPDAIVQTNLLELNAS